MKRLAWLGCVLLLACADGALPEREEAQAPPLQLALSTLAPTRVMNVVAHQDDDLGLMVPTLAHWIRDGVPVRTVYLTAGDAVFGCESYVVGRENGIRRAYEKMAGLTPSATADYWREELVTVGDKHVRQVSLRDKPVSLVFVGLSNGATDDASPLLMLWNGETASAATLPDSRRQGFVDSYDREALIELLRALIVLYAPDHLNTLDSSGIWPPFIPFEHPDHVASAFFALAAKQRTRRATTMRLHRAYNMLLEPENLGAAEQALKTELFELYWPNDLKICRTVLTDVCRPSGPANLQLCDDPTLVYSGFMTRTYAFDMVEARTNVSIKGPQRGFGARCLEPAASQLGAVLRLVSCNTTRKQQRFDLTDDGALRLSGSPYCVSASFAPGARGATPVLASCDRSPAQQFALAGNGQLRGPDASCVEARESALVIAACSGASTQLGWSVRE